VTIRLVAVKQHEALARRHPALPWRDHDLGEFAEDGGDGFRLSRGIRFLAVLQSAREAGLELSRQASDPVPTLIDRRFRVEGERPPQVQTHLQVPSVPRRSSEQLRGILPRRRRRFRGRTVLPTSSVSELSSALAYGKAVSHLATAPQGVPVPRPRMSASGFQSEGQRLRLLRGQRGWAFRSRDGMVAFPLKGRDEGLSEAFSYLLAV
jgi:hypothetical protein